MAVSWKIDWLTFTKNKWDVEVSVIDNRASALAWASIAAQEVGLWMTEFKGVGGQRFYPWVFECQLSRIRVSVPADPGVQGIMIVFPGKVLAQRAGTMNIIATALDHGWRCTRIDIAIDFMEDGLTVDDVHREFLSNAHKNSRTTGWIEGRGGNTFYLGSRQSNRFARVYDKGKEQGLAHEWTRIEVEYKGGVAQSVAERVQANSGQVLADVSSFFAKCNPLVSSRIDRLAGVPASAIELPPKPLSDRENWFRGQVTQALRNWAGEDYDSARSWLSSMLWQLDNGI